MDSPPPSRRLLREDVAQRADALGVDFKRYMKKHRPVQMALWKELNPDVPQLLDIFADYVAATIGVIGVGLLAGVIWGRSIALIVVGLLLLPILFFSRFVPLNLNGEFGEVRYAPSTVSQVQPEYRLAAGELRLDLSEIDLVGGTLNVLVEVGAGEVIIDLPPDAGLDIDASVGIGEIRLLARQHDTGIGIVTRVTEAGDGKLILEINLGAGSVEVRRQGSSQLEELSSEQVDEILYEIGDAIGEEIGDAIGGVTP